MRILLVDDEELSRESIADFLRMTAGHEVVETADGEEALAQFRMNPFPVVITDLKMPGFSGLELMSLLRKEKGGEETAVILITGFADLDSAIDALRQGARDYLRKPIDVSQLSRLLTTIQWEMDNPTPQTRPASDTPKEKQPDADSLVTDRSTSIDVPGMGTIIHASSSGSRAVQTALKLHEDRDIPVLIQGETGTGKEVIARLIHEGEYGSDKPFVSINCSAIPPSLFESELFGYESGAFTGARRGGNRGKFELANGGTLFLDEIGDLPLDMQPKLLRALQEREMYRIGGSKRIELDVRIIAATNRSLRELVESNRFRKDLLFRLEIGVVELPPLRNRVDDIFPLAQLFLLKLSHTKQRRFRYIDVDARTVLQKYPWPGNVRELKNVVERVVLLHDDDSLKASHLSFLTENANPLETDPGGLVKPGKIVLPEKMLNLNELEAEIIRKALLKHKGNQVRTAEYLGISRNTLRTKMKNWDLF